MSATLYAVFDDLDQARAAIGAMVRGGVPADSMTLACKSLRRQTPATDLNPAQSDSPVAPAAYSAPPAAERDYNEGIDADDYNQNYRGDVDRDMNRDGTPSQEFGGMAETFPDLRAQGPGNSFGDPSIAGLGTRYAGIAASANASVQPGHMTEFLWDTLPTDVAQFYQREYDGGKAIVVVRDPTPQAEELIRQQNPKNIQRQGYLA